MLFRIIPACAGNASRHSRHSALNSDHPRVCGERLSLPKPVRARGGSSPRVRGTLGLKQIVPGLGRIIPACAGNAACAIAMACDSPDHPRVCGERMARSGSVYPIPGSSPRVRGTRSGSRRAARHRRIIPACAGTACVPRASSPLPSDHPRVCGERVRVPMIRAAYGGSSPRVRGTRGVPSRSARRNRIIPACAGNAIRHTEKGGPTADHPRVCGERSLMPGPS